MPRGWNGTELTLVILVSGIAGFIGGFMLNAAVGS